jgi:hypothetical protein
LQVLFLALRETGRMLQAPSTGTLVLKGQLVLKGRPVLKGHGFSRAATKARFTRL